MTIVVRKCVLLAISGYALASSANAAPAGYRAGAMLPLAAAAPLSDDALASALLDLHNRERAAVGAPPLVWDPVLAASAANYAGALTVSGTLQHSPRSIRPGQGENLWMGTRGGFPVHAMVGAWSSEKRMFVPGVFPDVSRTGNWLDIAHYTQMIWRTTQRLGCAIRSSGRFDYLVCRYGSPGNRDGTRVP